MCGVLGWGWRLPEGGHRPSHPVRMPARPPLRSRKNDPLDFVALMEGQVGMGSTAPSRLRCGWK